VPTSLRASILVSTIGGLLAVSVAAAMLTPPAVGIADRYLTLSAILIAATVLTIIVMSRKLLDRERRLFALVLLMTTGGSWYAGRLWVHEKLFDYLVHSQKTDLQLTIVELAGDIEIFLRDRASHAPPRPSAATWERDVEAVLRYEEETSMMYEQRFGSQVRRTREVLALERLTDRDFDAFYRRPANAFQMDVVARRLLILARRLDRT
jgi:hypothetical protein